MPKTAKKSATTTAKQRSERARKAWKTMNLPGYKKNPKQFMAARRAA